MLKKINLVGNPSKSLRFTKEPFVPEDEKPCYKPGPNAHKLYMEEMMNYDSNKKMFVAPDWANTSECASYIEGFCIQSLNTAMMCHMPTLVAGSLDRGITIIGPTIYMETIQYTMDDPTFDFVGFCDGNSITILKRDGLPRAKVIF